VPNRPLRPLALVSLLAVGDYLLWNWSLGDNHDILALVAGLTLPPLLVSLAWLLVMSVAHTLGRALRRPWVRSRARAAGERRSAVEHRAGEAATGEPHTVRAGHGAAAAGETATSSKLAA
jgi:hypothetical protein